MWCGLPWALWYFALAACPVAIALVSIHYSQVQVGALPFNKPRAALAIRILDALVFAHLAVSVVATWSVVLLVRPGRRWIAWGAILVVGVFTLMLGLGAEMGVSGGFP
jgi:hypothetical protein